MYDIIFDFDGTLVYSNHIKSGVYNEVVSHLPNSAEVLDIVFSQLDLAQSDRVCILKRFADTMLEKYGTICDYKELVSSYTVICENEVSKADEVNGTTQALELLQKTNRNLAISSATPEYTLKNIVNRRCMSVFFDDVLGGPQSKQEHVVSMSKKWGTKLDKIIYVGDSELDQVAASAVGCNFISIGKNLDRFDHYPDNHIVDMHGLLNMVYKIEAC